MGRGAATLGAMSNSPNATTAGGAKSLGSIWRARTPSKASAFLAEALALLLADLLRSVLSDASPALPADESAVERYRHLADSLADGETRRRTSLGITRAGLAKRCVTWLKLLLTPAPNAPTSAPMREFVDALGLVPGAVRQRTLGPLTPRPPDLAPHSRSAARRQHPRGRHGPDRGLRASGGVALARRRSRLTTRVRAVRRRPSATFGSALPNGCIICGPVAAGVLNAMPRAQSRSVEVVDAPRTGQVAVPISEAAAPFAARNAASPLPIVWFFLDWLVLGAASRPCWSSIRGGCGCSPPWWRPCGSRGCS